MNNNRIRRIDLTTMTVSTVLGTGEPTYTGDGAAAVDATIAVHAASPSPVDGCTSATPATT